MVRVGGLAIALGVGAAVAVGGAGVAWADRPEGQDAGSPAASDARATRGTAGRGAPRLPGPDAVGRGPVRADDRPARVTPDSERIADDVRGSGHVAVAPPRVTPHTAAALPAPPRPAAFTPDITAPVPPPVTPPAPRPVAAVPALDPPVSGTAPALVVAPAAASAIPAVVRPLPAQAVRSAEIPVAARVLAALFGSSPFGAESPVSWAVLAATRRQGSATVTRTVVPAATTTLVNNPPVITNVVLSAPNSSTGAVTGTVTASDPDTGKIAYKASTSTKGTVSITTSGVFTYTPTATARHAAAKIGATTAITTDTVTVTVTDAKGAATSKPVTVPILPKNAVPTATKAVGTPNATTGSVTGTVTGADADRDPLTYTASAPAKGAVTITTAGAFTYTPTATARHAAAKLGATTADKSDAFTVTVADGYGGSLAVQVGVAVRPANSAPTATAAIAKPDPVSGVAKGFVSAADSDRDTLTFTASKPPNGTVSVKPDGSFAYTPTATARASARTSTSVLTDTFTITVADGYGGSRAVGVTATIAPADSAPVAGTPTATVNTATGVVTGNVNATDPDKDPLTYTAASTTTAKGTATVTTAGAYTYTPTATARHAAARTGAVAADKADTFAVTVADKHGATTVVPVTVTISAANTAPVAATTTVGTPDPVTRVVTGTVRAIDADNDPLTYTAPPATAKGNVALTNGSFTYTPAATTAAGTDTFTVTVSDGYGGSVAVPLTVSIAAVTQPGTLSTFCGCTLMPADTVFHANVSSLPVLAKSATWTTLLGGNLFAAWGGDPWMGNTAGMPVNTVAATRAGETVIFNRGYATSGPSIDSSPYAIPDYPLVEGMPSAPAWDRHLLVFQEGTCVSQELYNVANGVELPAAGFADALANSIYASNYGSTWLAEAGVHYNMNSPLYPAIGWANASQLPYLPLILRPDDLTRGSIDHMLGITIAKDRGTGYAWPARAGDGTGTNPDGVPMGTVFRLKPDFDISGFDPATQVILRALQQHGAVVYDSGNPGQNGATLMAMSNGWTGTGYLTAQQQLRTIPLSAFEAVDVLSLAADPKAGWAIRSTAV
jgi:VCBS repeat-containing protein